MHHNVFGRKLNRDTGQRQALLRGLAGAIVRSEAIETTEAKAEAARGLIEKLITQARRASVNDLRQIESVLLNKDLVHKLVHNIAPRFKDRPGGYLRLIKLGTRTGDNAPMVRMELVESALQVSSSPEVEKEVVKKEVAPKAAAPKAEPKKVASKAKPASTKASKSKTK